MKFEYVPKKNRRVLIERWQLNIIHPWEFWLDHILCFYVDLLSGGWKSKTYPDFMAKTEPSLDFIKQMQGYVVAIHLVDSMNIPHIDHFGSTVMILIITLVAMNMAVNVLDIQNDPQPGRKWTMNRADKLFMNASCILKSPATSRFETRILAINWRYIDSLWPFPKIVCPEFLIKFDHFPNYFWGRNMRKDP